MTGSKRGEIEDPWDASNDTPQLASLREELRQTMDSHRDVIVKNEFDALYKGAGAVGMNAFTSEDVTFYINQLPANKFELWCWMESDRLANSVFREFFSERDVVHEERRMRTESYANRRVSRTVQFHVLAGFSIFLARDWLAQRPKQLHS